MTTLIISAIHIYKYLMCIFFLRSQIKQCKGCNYNVVCLFYNICFSGKSDRRSSGGSASAGKVEIQYQGQWGTVCEGGWDKNDAHVICRMLGYKAADAAIVSIEGETSRRMLIYNVGCSGNEKSIAECSHNGWWKVASWCDNRFNAGVVCQTGGGKKDKYLLHYNRTDINKSKAII